MGNNASSDDGEAYPNQHNNTLDQFDGIETLGYRVLGVQPNSPASSAGLVSFFDFLVGANGKMLLGSGEGLEEGEEYEDIDFPALLEEYKGKPLELLVWNIKSQKQRFVEIVPNDDWSGTGLLGVTIRLDNYAGAEDRLIRILHVEHNSPASIAGLVTEQDYLLGTTTHSFDNTKVLANILEHSVDRVVELYVYNTNSDKVRVVALMPTWSWGGNGLLGAEVGTGYCHRLPSACRETLGGSVERRVRWVNKNANNTTTVTSGGQQQNSEEQKQQQQQHTPSGRQQQKEEGASLELEPQLEMETSIHSEDEQIPVEAVRHKVPLEEKEETASAPIKEFDDGPQIDDREKNEEQTNVASKEGTKESPSETLNEAKEFFLSSSLPSAADTTVEANSSENENSSSFFPPPPKMSCTK